MDYKTTFLQTEVQADEILLPEIENLYFGILDQNRAVFDYTSYIEANNLPVIDYKAFMRMNRHYIEALIKPTGLKTSELFYQNTNNHILVAAELVFLFLAFINPELCVYFNSLLAEAISDGVAYSHGFLYSMIAQKLPSEVLTEIIKERNHDQTRDDE